MQVQATDMQKSCGFSEFQTAELNAVLTIWTMKALSDVRDTEEFRFGWQTY